MANLAHQLARLQLGGSGSRHRPSRRLYDTPNVNINASSLSLQCSSLYFSLLSSLQCPAQRVLSLKDQPVSGFNGQDTGFPRSGPVFQVAYAHTTTFIAAVDEEGVVGIMEATEGRRKCRWMAHHNAIFDVIWTQDDAQLLTAAGDLQIKIWDVETSAMGTLAASNPVSTLRGHDMSVKCVRQAPDRARLFASGGRDGKVLLWDTRITKKAVLSLENVHAGPTPSLPVNATTSRKKKRRRGATTALPSSSPRSVTCVEFGATENEIITAGAVDARVKFWDIRRLGLDTSGKKRATALFPVPIREISCSSREGARRGIASMMFSPRGARGASHLLVNVLNDSIAVIDVGHREHGTEYQEASTKFRCFGHQASSFYCKTTFSPDGDFIAGASVDGVVYIWDARVSTSYNQVMSSTWSCPNVQQRAPYLALKAHTDEVNGVTWSSRDFTQLASCSDDGTVRCWQFGSQGNEPLKSPPPDRGDGAARFELQFASQDESCESIPKAEWANWSTFVTQPDGFAYPVRGATRARVSESSHSLSPRSRRVYPVAQRTSPQVMRHSIEPRLHPVHEIPIAQLQPQEAREAQPQPKRRIKLRRNTKPAIQSKRAQRTLLELWGR